MPHFRSTHFAFFPPPISILGAKNEALRYAQTTEKCEKLGTLCDESSINRALSYETYM